MHAPRLHELDHYITGTLLPDLVGHDRSPSAFLVYLVLSTASKNACIAISHAELAERTGLSRRAVQIAVAHLRGRGLLALARRGPTDTSEYRVLTPWRR